MTNFDVTGIEMPDGTRALVVQPVVRDAAPEGLKNGLAIRREANVTGVCPSCGAVMSLPNRAARRRAARTGEALLALMCHEDDCPVLTDGDGGTS